MNRPLEGIIALDFSQYLAGPSAALRLADLGARVIKVENPKTGDSSRHLSLKNMVYDGDSVNFQAINRDKESFAANLKDPEDLKLVKALVKKADVLIENFRPGIMAKFGLDYESASVLNPRLVYATVTGYGTEGPWKSKPGQDLLLQSMSGLAYTNGNGDQPPTPLGISMADTFAGNHMVDGILACLVRRSRTGKGGRVEVSLLESILYLQLEGLTTYLNNGHKPPVRSRVCNAHPNVPAPYGIYETSDGYIAVSMGSVSRLGHILGCPELAAYTDESQWFQKRDEIQTVLARHLKGRPTSVWLTLLDEAGYWASAVLNWRQLTGSAAYQALDFSQDIRRPDLPQLLTTRCPIRCDGQLLRTRKWAPRLGEDTARITEDLALKEGN